MTADARSRLTLEHQTRGWVAYGLREVVVERMHPDLMQIETTSACNLRCVFCPYDEMTRARQHMDTERFAHFLADQAAHVSAVGLHHFGEPFLNPALPRYVAICSELGIETTASTNATRISSMAAEAVVGAGLGRLIISIDAALPETYAALRRRGRLADVHEGVDRVLAAKLAAGSGTPYVQVQFIVTPENADEWEPFRDRWVGRPGVDQVVVRDERTHAGQRVRHDEYRLPARERLPCRYLWESVVILADGRVVPCCKDFDGKEVLGNVFEGDRLEDIWNGRRMVELRRAHVERRFGAVPLCATCEEWRGHAPLSEEESVRAYARHRLSKAESRRGSVYRRDYD